MHKLRSYISVILLALLLIPMAEKVQHEMGHLHEEHCDLEGLHYCATEHTCNVCDYISSSTGFIPTDSQELNATTSSTEVLFVVSTSNPVVSTKYTFSLRGPPAC